MFLQDSSLQRTGRVCLNREALEAIRYQRVFEIASCVLTTSITNVNPFVYLNTPGSSKTHRYSRLLGNRGPGRGK